MNHDEIDIDILPGVLREMVDLIGMPATMKIVQTYGGTRLWVPGNIATLAPDHKLVKLLGISAAHKLSEQFGGQDHFDIPKAEAALRAVRNKEIRQLWPKYSQRELALKYSMTERAIRKIIGKNTDNRQMSFNF